MKRRMRTGSMVRRLAAILTAVGVAGALALPHVTYAQQTEAELHIMPVRGNVFMIVGGGSNVTVSAGVDGILLVDAGSAAMADKPRFGGAEGGYVASSGRLVGSGQK